MRVSSVTARIWAREGRLLAHTRDGGQGRFAVRDLRDFARRNGMTLGGERYDRTRILVVEDELQCAAFMSGALRTLDPTPEIKPVCDGFEVGRRLKRFVPVLALKNH